MTPENKLRATLGLLLGTLLGSSLVGIYMMTKASPQKSLT